MNGKLLLFLAVDWTFAILAGVINGLFWYKTRPPEKIGVIYTFTKCILLGIALMFLFGYL